MSKPTGQNPGGRRRVVPVKVSVDGSPFVRYGSLKEMAQALGGEHWKGLYTHASGSGRAKVLVYNRHTYNIVKLDPEIIRSAPPSAPAKPLGIGALIPKAEEIERASGPLLSHPKTHRLGRFFG
jgi:hypothetical protein